MMSVIKSDLENKLKTKVQTLGKFHKYNKEDINGWKVHIYDKIRRQVFDKFRKVSTRILKESQKKSLNKP